MGDCSRGISRIGLWFVILLIFSIYQGNSQDIRGLKTVVIDAGHGGKDPGTVVGKAREKDIVLDIALRLGKSIKEKLPDVRVVYTRKTDIFIPLFERSVIANRNNADLFISIHANFCESPAVKGTETYVLGLHRTEDNLNVAKKENSVILFENDYTTRYEGFDPNLSESYIIFELIQNTHLEQSVAFAGIVQDLFRNHAKRASRDVRQAGFLVLRETAMPAVLIETGYLSNQSESNYLMTPEGRDAIALSVFNSFKSYKEKFESRMDLAAQVSKNQPEERIDTTPVEQPVQLPDRVIADQPSEVKVEKEPITKVQEVKKQTAVTGQMITGQITFAVQISAYPRKLPQNSRLFKGIENVSEFILGGYYKYYCLETSSFSQVKKNLSQIRMKIPDAFVIAFKDGKPISVKEAINDR